MPTTALLVADNYELHKLHPFGELATPKYVLWLSNLLLLESSSNSSQQVVTATSRNLEPVYASQSKGQYPQLQP